jgi:ankyrin repeat protein
VIKPPELDTDRGRDVWETISAAATGDVPVLRRVLERDPDLARSEYSPLRLAVREGHLEAVRVLLDAGADPGLTGFQGDTLIEIARDRGYDAIASVLETARDRQGRVAPAETHADHPIHSAAEAGDLRRVRVLLDADPALVHRSDRAGGTPLHRAVIGRASDVIALLLDRGADIHAVHGAGLGSRSGYAPQDCQPIDLAIWGGPVNMRLPTWRLAIAYVRRRLASRLNGPTRSPCDVETARLLLKRGAMYDLAVAAALGDLDRVTAILDKDPDRIREARPNGRRALSAAVEFGREPIVRLLLERGADPSWPDADAPKGAALHAAARAGDRRLVELLLAHGADPNGHVDSAGNATFVAKTPALRALLVAHGGKVDPYDLVWMGDDDEVMRRVTQDPSSANAGCGGVFTAVCTLGKRDLLVRLLDAGIRVPPVAGGCQSYLLHNPDMLRVLLTRGMNPDYPNWQHMTLLHALCSRDIRDRTMAHRTECATILLDAGATISARDDEYRSTPLAWAARNDLPDMVELLLARGAPANLPDDAPWATPLAWATKRGHATIAAMLRRAGATV